MVGVLVGLYAHFPLGNVNHTCLTFLIYANLIGMMSIMFIILGWFIPVTPLLWTGVICQIVSLFMVIFVILYLDC